MARRRIFVPSFVISSNASLGVAFYYAVARILLIPRYASKLLRRLDYNDTWDNCDIFFTEDIKKRDSVRSYEIP